MAVERASETSRDFNNKRGYGEERKCIYHGHYWVFWALFTKSREAPLSSVMSVRLSAYVISAPRGRIFMKFGIGDHH
jgi:hypothetical protein